MNPAQYDAWYDSARGRWIGETEYRLVERELAAPVGAQLLDVGCGTGWFTRRLTCRAELSVVGLDIDADRLAYARRRDPRSSYVRADALALPFDDGRFDAVLSVVTLCFTRNWQNAVSEIVRVCRGRFAIGMLNRHSRLWREKGRDGGSGAYRGAHWVTAQELADCVARLPVADARVCSAVFLPSASAIARVAEGVLPCRLPWGSFLVLSGCKLDKADRPAAVAIGQ